MGPRYSPGVMIVARITGSEKETTSLGSGKREGLDTSTSVAGSDASRALYGTVGLEDRWTRTSQGGMQTLQLREVRA